MLRHAIIGSALAVLAGCSRAPAAPAVAVTDAWARATAPGQSTAAVYATIANDGAADRLVGVSTSKGMAMLHASAQSDGIARMRSVAEVAIPAGGRADLVPGGTHIMVSGLAAPLVVGSDLSATLRFAGGGPRTVKVAIVAPGAR